MLFNMMAFLSVLVLLIERFFYFSPSKDFAGDVTAGFMSVL